jgi:sugar/nucleoside kinase (ribokinase family)
MVAQTVNVCVVGSFSLDSIIAPRRDNPFHTLGGATTFTSFAVKTLGGSVSVVSRVGGDFPEAYLRWLHETGIDVSAVKRYPPESTTKFELCYSNDFSERALKLVNKGRPIDFDDIPRDLYARIIHVAPIAGEISYELVQQLRSCCDFLSFDPQGVLRSFDENGNVSLNLQIDKRVLNMVNICKVSLDELFVLTGLSEIKAAIQALHAAGVELVIVTMGAKGSLLSVKGVCYNVPACQSTMLVDPTGAGDVFIGAFLTEYMKNREPLWCAYVGSAAASFIVEDIGPMHMGKKDQIYKRAQTICKNEVK